VKQIRDGVVVTEHLDDDRYIESTLREIDRDVRAYVEALPPEKRGRDVMREIMPAVGCENRVADLLARIPGDQDREAARLAVEWAMLAVQAHEHVIVKSVEPEIVGGHRVSKGRSIGGQKAAAAKRGANAARDKHLVMTARRLINDEHMPAHRVVGHMIQHDMAGILRDDALREILQAAGVISKRKAARS
jgi:hypothetical protein